MVVSLRTVESLIFVDIATYLYRFLLSTGLLSGNLNMIVSVFAKTGTCVYSRGLQSPIRNCNTIVHPFSSSSTGFDCSALSIYESIVHPLPRVWSLIKTIYRTSCNQGSSNFDVQV